MMEEDSKGKDIEKSEKKFPYPDCWEDKERLNVLMSPFRTRDVNPIGYDSKMKFWQDIIKKYCEHKGTSVFCKNELQLTFKKDGHMPHGLDKVLEEMQRTKQIRLLGEYQCDPLRTWKGLVVNCALKRPLFWTWYKLRSAVGAIDENQNASTQFVHIDVLNNFCMALKINVLPQHKGELLHYDEFKDIVKKSMDLTEDTLQLCLLTLYCQQKIGLNYKEKEQQIHLVKIPSKTDTSPTITENDMAIHNLKLSKASLTKWIDCIEPEMKKNEELVRQYLSENKRSTAKIYLRKKHELEEMFAKKSNALHNIETLLLSIEEAKTNSAVLESYKYGSKALKNILDESGLQYDKVDEIVLDVRSTLSEHKELQDTIANVDAAAAPDDDALEKELKELMEETDLLKKLDKLKVEDHSPQSMVKCQTSGQKKVVL